MRECVWLLWYESKCVYENEGKSYSKEIKGKLNINKKKKWKLTSEKNIFENEI